MFDFVDVRAASKSEQVRAYSIEQAIDTFSGIEATDEEVIGRAAAIEAYILKGKDSNG